MVSPVLTGPLGAQRPPGLAAFSFRLFAAAAGEDGNACLSPWSAAIALAMARAGAAGDTASQLDAALGVADGGAWREVARLREAVAPPSVRAGDREVEAYELAVANAAWVQQEPGLQQDYVKVLTDVFEAPPRTIDFRLPAARSTINRWVESRTGNRIRDLFPPGRPDPDSILVLVNCVYLNAPWAVPFPEHATRKEEFALIGKTAVEVDTMVRTGRLHYARTEHAHVVDLPLRGDVLAMRLIVPLERDGVARAQQEMAASWPMRDALAPTRVELHLPRWSLSCDYELRDPLRALGIADAFERDRADFSPMTGGKDLFISTVVHKTFVRVDEAGTEAAAATGVGMAPTSAPLPEDPIVVRADRPFLFVILHRDSGAILFIGRVADPRG